MTAPHENPLGGMALRPQLEDYDAFARRVLDACLTWGPWIDGQPRLHAAPLVISGELRDRLYDVARRVGALYDELAGIVWGDPALLEGFFALTPWQRRMWLASGGHWHVFARLDAFVCTDGQIVVCELNADTPSGQDDAIGLSALIAEGEGELIDPNAGYLDRLWEALVRTCSACTGRKEGPRAVAVIYPTEMVDDLGLVRLYARDIEARGIPVVLGSPYNVEAAPGGGVQVLGQRVDLILRHYKTDWWGERLPIWKDEPPYDDPDPLDGPLSVLLDAEQAGRACVANPFGALIPQNKLAMAFFWEHLGRFSPRSQATIRAHIPETLRAERLGAERLCAERADWVLKSNYGCEGDEVILGALVDDEAWGDCVDMLQPGTWIAQRRFDAAPLAPGWLPNLGVYLIGGVPSGLFVRLTSADTITCADTLVAPVLTSPRPGEAAEASR